MWISHLVVLNFITSGNDYNMNTIFLSVPDPASLRIVSVPCNELFFVPAAQKTMDQFLKDGNSCYDENIAYLTTTGMLPGMFGANVRIFGCTNPSSSTSFILGALPAPSPTHTDTS